MYPQVFRRRRHRCLAPAGTGMGRTSGYTVADYLLQQATRKRQAIRVPASTWDALLLNISDPADADGYAARELAVLLEQRGDLEGLRGRADAGAGDVSRLAELLARQGHDEEAKQLRRYGLNPDGSIASR